MINMMTVLTTRSTSDASARLMPLRAILPCTLYRLRLRRPSTCTSSSLVCKQSVRHEITKAQSFDHAQQTRMQSIRKASALSRLRCEGLSGTWACGADVTSSPVSFQAHRPDVKQTQEPRDCSQRAARMPHIPPPASQI